MRRRGFTLVELVVSLGIVGILSLAMSSSIMLSTRALPSSTGFAERQAAMGRALLGVSEDVRTSLAVKIFNTKTLKMTVPDITGDATDDIIVYEWGGNAGDPLTRTLNSTSPQSVIPDVTGFKLSVIDGVSVNLIDRTVVSPQRLGIEVSSGTAEPLTVSTEIRLLNARMP